MMNWSSWLYLQVQLQKSRLTEFRPSALAFNKLSKQIFFIMKGKLKTKVFEVKKGKNLKSITKKTPKMIIYNRGQYWDSIRRFQTRKIKLFIDF